jgi:hypothetical protein
LVFISDNFVSRKLGNLAPNHHEAVEGFFDASQERADNTSFEGYETNYHDDEITDPAKANLFRWLGLIAMLALLGGAIS